MSLFGAKTVVPLVSSSLGRLFRRRRVRVPLELELPAVAIMLLPYAGKQRQVPPQLRTLMPLLADPSCYLPMVPTVIRRTRIVQLKFQPISNPIRTIRRKLSGKLASFLVVDCEQFLLIPC